MLASHTLNSTLTSSPSSFLSLPLEGDNQELCATSLRLLTKPPSRPSHPSQESTTSNSVRSVLVCSDAGFIPFMPFSSEMGPPPAHFIQSFIIGMKIPQADLSDRNPPSMTPTSYPKRNPPRDAIAAAFRLKIRPSERSLARVVGDWIKSAETKAGVKILFCGGE